MECPETEQWNSQELFLSPALSPLQFSAKNQHNYDSLSLNHAQSSPSEEKLLLEAHC